MDAPFSLPDGLHLNVPFDEYLRWPVYSQSTLKEGRRSMAHLRAAVLGERVKVPTDDMVLGSALHTCFLEPHMAQERVVLWDGGRRAGKEWEAFKSYHAKKTILTENQHEKLSGMIESLRRHQEVKKWLKKIESVEVSAIGDVCGLRVKGRCDALTSEPLIDLKKISDGSVHKVLRTVLDYGYDCQGWLYCQLFNRDRFMLVTVEDEPPYDVAAFELSPGFLRRGGRLMTDIIERVKECEKREVWPGRSDKPILLEVPEYASEETELE